MATKRIKKVDTPIDARETFVSLQKNFADADVSVLDRLKTLYALQEADSNIDKILQLRGELPEEVEALEEKIESLKAKQAQEEAVIAAYNDTLCHHQAGTFLDGNLLTSQIISDELWQHTILQLRAFKQRRNRFLLV